MLFDLFYKEISAINKGEKDSFFTFPEIEDRIRLGSEGMKFCPTRMRNYPAVLTLTKYSEAPPGFGENDLVRGDFHD